MSCPSPASYRFSRGSPSRLSIRILCLFEQNTLKYCLTLSKWCNRIGPTIPGGPFRAFTNAARRANRMFSRRPTTEQSVVALVVSQAASHSPIGIRASICLQLKRVRVSLRQIRTAAAQNTVRTVQSFCLSNFFSFICMVPYRNTGGA